MDRPQRNVVPGLGLNAGVDVSRIGFLAAAAAAIAPSAAEAVTGPYVRFGGGIGMSGSVEGDDDSVNLEPGLQAHGAFGYEFDGPVRLEAEALYLENPIDTDGAVFEGLGVNDVTASAAGSFANLFVDLSEGKVRPFIGGGAGFVRGEFAASNGDITASTHEDAAAYQLMVGAAMDLGSNTTLDVGYRMFNADFDDVATTVHSIGATIRFRFGAGEERQAHSTARDYAPPPPYPPPLSPEPYAPSPPFQASNHAGETCLAVFDRQTRAASASRAGSQVFGAIFREYDQCISRPPAR
jgi:opacity protein-like surface antigen